MCFLYIIKCTCFCSAEFWTDINKGNVKYVYPTFWIFSHSLWQAAIECLRVEDCEDSLWYNTHYKSIVVNSNNINSVDNPKSNAIS